MRCSFRLFVAIAALVLAMPGRGTASECEAAGQLTFYTTQFERDAKALGNAFARRCPSIDIHWVRAPAHDLYDMISDELDQGGATADVVILSSGLSMMKLKLAGRLKPLPDMDLETIRPEFYDAGRTFFATKLITSVFVGRKTDAKPLPRSWAQLEGMAAERRIAYPRVMTSYDARAFFLAIVNDPELGWAHVERLARAGVKPNSTLGRAAADVVTDQADIGITADYLAVELAQKGLPIAISFPEDAAPVAAAPVGVISTTRNPVAARAFVAFILSRAWQVSVRSHGFIPVRSDIPTPPDFPDRQTMRFIMPDLTTAIVGSGTIYDRYLEIFGEGASD